MKKSVTLIAQLDEDAVAEFMRDAKLRARRWKEEPVEMAPGVWSAMRVEEIVYCARSREKLESFLDCDCGVRTGLDGRQAEIVCARHRQ